MEIRLFWAFQVEEYSGTHTGKRSQMTSSLSE